MLGQYKKLINISPDGITRRVLRYLIRPSKVEQPIRSVKGGIHNQVGMENMFKVIYQRGVPSVDTVFSIGMSGLLPHIPVIIHSFEKLGQ